MIVTIDSKETASGLYLARDTRDSTYVASFTVDSKGVRVSCTFNPSQAIVFDSEHIEAFFAFQRLCGNCSYEAFAVVNFFSKEVTGNAGDQ